MRKLILSILGILLIIGSGLFAKKLIANKNKPKPVKEKIVKTVFTDTVKNSNIQIIIPSNGSLTAKRRIELYAEVQGIFTPSAPLFKTGQTYKKGQRLIKIDDSEYQASVQAAKSSFYNSLASIMPDLLLDFPDSYKKWQSYLNDFDINNTLPELPETTTESENYFITGKGITSSYYNVKNLEQRLFKYIIKAPFTGILTKAEVTEGTLIRSGQKLGEFIDPSVYEMEVAISKNYATLLELHKTVQLTNLDGTETYTGTITRINASIDASTQTVSAFIEVKDKNLKEGLYLNALIEAKEETNAIEIDRNLLTENNEIFVIKDNVLELISVNPVHFSKTKVVLKGVPEGTIILKKQVSGAYAGMLVKTYNN